MEWQLTEDGQYIPIDDAKEFVLLAVYARALAAASREHIATSRRLVQEVRQRAFEWAARRAWPVRSLTIQ